MSPEILDKYPPGFEPPEGCTSPVVCAGLDMCLEWQKQRTAIQKGQSVRLKCPLATGEIDLPKTPPENP